MDYIRLFLMTLFYGSLGFLLLTFVVMQYYVMSNILSENALFYCLVVGAVVGFCIACILINED